jgi:translation initiation factor 2 subunit 1
MHECEERYRKSRLVHSILHHVACTVSVNLEDLYTAIGWPLYHHYGHAYDAFKLIASDPTSSTFDSLTREVREMSPNGEVLTKVVPAVTEEVKVFLIKNISQKMAHYSLKIRAIVELKCYQFDGVLHIQVIFLSSFLKVKNLTTYFLMLQQQC